MAKKTNRKSKFQGTKKAAAPLLTEQLTLDQHEFVKVDEYKGHKLLAFNQGPADEYPFSFGAEKAARLLAGFAEYGEEYVIRELVKIAGDRLAPIHQARLAHFNA